MTPPGRPVIYSLLTIVFILLLGMLGIIRIAYQRHRRLEDQSTEFQRNFFRQESRIKNLQEQLEHCDTLLRNNLTPVQ